MDLANDLFQFAFPRAQNFNLAFLGSGLLLFILFQIILVNEAASWEQVA
jgi:hypothetical protein